MRQKTGTAEGVAPPELVAPWPPVAPDAAPLEEAQAARPPIAAPVRPRAVPLAGAVPTGPVRVRPPWGGTFNLDWHNITRWGNEFDAAYSRFPRVPRPVLEAICLVEAAGEHYNDDGSVRVRPSDGFDNVPAVGMMQVKLGYHAHLVPDANGWTPGGNVLLAAALMDKGIAAHGTWQRAFVSVYFTGTDYQTGTTQAAYVETIEGVFREWPTSGGGPPPPPANAGQKVANVAQRQLGKPYRNPPKWRDCSSFVRFCIEQATDIRISGDSHTQFTLGMAVPQAQIRAGDVLCFDTQGGQEVREGNTCSHTGIATGSGTMVSAMSEEIGVRDDDPFGAYFGPLFLGARRIAQSPVIEPEPGPEPTPLDPWRPYPYPKMVDLLVTKPYDGAGFDRVEYRRPLIRGFCTHITDGPQTQAIEFFQHFFSTGGSTGLRRAH